jgi:hypothetical protein
MRPEELERRALTASIFLFSSGDRATDAAMARWKDLIARFLPRKEWRKIEFFDDRWKNRIRGMSRHVGAKDSVLDLGCGPMWLKEFLGPENSYHGCDYLDRGPGTLVCDFNAKQFPDVKADVTFISGCLEYVEDVEWFIDRVAAAAPKCVIAYCIVNPGDNLARRRQNAWVNDLTEEGLIALMGRHGLQFKEKGERFMSSQIYVFEQSRR